MVIDKNNLDSLRKRANSLLVGTALAVLEEAVKRGIKVELPFDNFKLMWLYLTPGAQPVEIRRTLTHDSSPISMAITIDKSLSYKVADSVGMRLLPWLVTSSDQEAIKFFRSHDGKCIIKPAKGQAGRDIITSFTDEHDFIAKHKSLSLTDSVVIQAKSSGKNDVRLLFIGNKFSAATVTRCTELSGDGVKTFRQLIVDENARRQDSNQARQRTMQLTKLNINEATVASEIQPGMVPGSGVRVVASLSNTTKGGIAQDVTSIIHHSFVEEAVKLVKRLNLPVVAVDFICDDIDEGRDIEDSNAYFLEANSAPGLDMHIFPHEGEGVNVAGMFIDYLISESAK